jgi:hypothetical protein
MDFWSRVVPVMTTRLSLFDLLPQLWLHGFEGNFGE